MDEELKDFWKDRRRQQQAKRAFNREHSTRILSEAGISFQSLSNGSHLVLPMGDSTIDFWPGTGRWTVRGSYQEKRGVKSLVAAVKGDLS